MKKLHKRILIAIGLIPLLVINHYVFDDEFDLTGMITMITIL